jgi:uncharacterized membrane protein
MEAGDGLGKHGGRLKWRSSNTSTASTIRAAVTQHWAGKALSRLNGKWLKQALGAARKRDRSKLFLRAGVRQLTVRGINAYAEEELSRLDLLKWS